MLYTKPALFTFTLLFLVLQAVAIAINIREELYIATKAMEAATTHMISIVLSVTATCYVFIRQEFTHD